jgi:hypothetical protein
MLERAGAIVLAPSEVGGCIRSAPALAPLSS